MIPQVPQTAIVMCKYLPLKGLPNSNCNVLVLYFQRGHTTISYKQIKKSFKPTSIPKKLFVKVSSKKFWEDYQIRANIYTKWYFCCTKLWFLEIEVLGLSIILWKCDSWTEKYPSGSAKRRKKESVPCTKTQVL